MAKGERDNGQDLKPLFPNESLPTSSHQDMYWADKSASDSHIVYDEEMFDSSETLQPDDEVQSSQPTSLVDGEDGEEVTPLEYARDSGLCVDFMSENPKDLMCRLPKPKCVHLDLQDPQGAFRLDSTVHRLPMERLKIDINAANLLRSVLVPPELASSGAVEAIRLETCCRKLELPLLTTDHELDILHFGGLNVPTFETTAFPMERVDIENDEGMEWSSQLLELAAKVSEEADMEKLKLDKRSPSSEYLIHVLRPHPVDEEMEELFAAQLNYVRNTALAPLTPPLLPLSPPLTPFEPLSVAGDLPLLSDETDPTIAEAQKLAEQLTIQDSLAPMDGANVPNNTDELIDLYSPLRSVLDSSSPTLALRRRPGDLKVDVPLTPDDTAVHPKKLKTVSFPEMLHEYIPQAQPATTGPEESSSLADYDVFFDEIIEPFAREADQAIEQEQLQEADSLHRVEVPVMDFSQPKPPWSRYGLKPNGKHVEGQTEAMAQQKLLVEVKRVGLQIFSRWPGIDKLNKVLDWNPFPSDLSMAAVHETIDDANYMSVVMDDVSAEDVVISDMLTWKPDGLRILDELEESEDELETFEVEETPRDMDGLLRKRRRDLATEHGAETLCASTARILEKGSMTMNVPVRRSDGPSNTNVSYAAELLRPSSTNQSPGKRRRIVKCTIPQHSASKLSLVQPSQTIPSVPKFSASNALAKFMLSMGKTPRKLETIPLGQHEVSAVPVSTVIGATPAAVEEQAESAVVPPIPQLPPNPPARTFVISTELYRNRRSLMRFIGRIYENANYIERDFSATPTVLEADMILSPATGLVLTTLQRIRQRALPGQENRVLSVKDRLLDLSNRYEGLVVLVSEGTTGASRILDTNESLALAEMVAFGTRIDCDVEILYVAGGEEVLAKWIVEQMLKNSISSGNADFPEVETLWEQILRRAGLNAFAALAVLADLTYSDADVSVAEISSSSVGNIESTPPTNDFRIQTFMRMDPAKRVRRFQRLLGGRRVLDRINDKLRQEIYG